MSPRELISVIFLTESTMIYMPASSCGPGQRLRPEDRLRDTRAGPWFTLGCALLLGILDSILHGTLVSSLIGMLTNDLFLILSTSRARSLSRSARRAAAASSSGCLEPHASVSEHESHARAPTHLLPLQLVAMCAVRLCRARCCAVYALYACIARSLGPHQSGG